MPYCPPRRPLQALRRLSLAAPFSVLARFVQDLGPFSGLERLELQPAEVYETDEDGERLATRDRAAVLQPSLLSHLPPQLGSLELRNFYVVELATEVADGAEAAGRSEPAQLLPGLSRLDIGDTYAVRLNMPLPGLAELAVHRYSRISLAGQQLHLPQLTSLSLRGGPSATQSALPELALRCGAMPALARLETSSGDCRLVASDSFSVPQHLADLDLTFSSSKAESGVALVRTFATSLRSLKVHVTDLWSDQRAEQAAQALAGAGTTQLTQLVG